MFKFKKTFLSLVLCSITLLSCVSGAFAADTRSAVYECPSCGSNSYAVSTTYSMVNTYRSPCVHYSAGYDIYGVYQYVDTGTCSACGYSSSEAVGEKYYSDTIYRCEGYGVVKH
jgi:ribosomal protein L37E